MEKENSIAYLLKGRFALFSDPITRVGGEKLTYMIPTYQALKGITESIYWKPTIIWYVDKLRVMKAIQTQSKGMRTIKYNNGSNDLSIYTYLYDVEYQVKAHFEWNMARTDLAKDQNENKHFFMAKRMMERGGRRDIFLGTRECQGYVEPCSFGEGSGVYDSIPELSFGLMFHGFNYPDESGRNTLETRFFTPVMRNGVVTFCRPEECELVREIRPMEKKEFILDKNVITTEREEDAL